VLRLGVEDDSPDVVEGCGEAAAHDPLQVLAPMISVRASCRLCALSAQLILTRFSCLARASTTFQHELNQCT
jgi:hypothetical protein